VRRAVYAGLVHRLNNEAFSRVKIDAQLKDQGWEWAIPMPSGLSTHSPTGPEPTMFCATAMAVLSR